MADIIYTWDGNTYFNLTNKCPCNCAFCIRRKQDAVGEAKRLWFDEEPTFADVKAAIDAHDFSSVKEAVFCGYGEPTNACFAELCGALPEAFIGKRNGTAFFQQRS